MLTEDEELDDRELDDELLLLEDDELEEEWEEELEEEEEEHDDDELELELDDEDDEFAKYLRGYAQYSLIFTDVCACVRPPVWGGNWDRIWRCRWRESSRKYASMCVCVHIIYVCVYVYVYVYVYYMQHVTQWWYFKYYF